ncbi:MAG: AMP-binding protein [Hyphomicrobiales bacterium]|nr:AMP-binding protein [Hyphomicrobiales bacterium]
MLGDLTRRNLRLRADAPAIVFEGRTIAHRAFAERAFRLSQALRRRGIGRGDRVAVLAQNRPEYMEAYAAGELGGWATVTINYRLTAPEIAYILGDSAPAALIVERELVPKIAEAVLRSLKHVLVLDDEHADTGYEAALAAAAPDDPRVAIAASDTAFLIYTSGTTGRPKGVMLSHGGQTQSARISAIEAQVAPTDRFALTMPLYHIGARNLWLKHSLFGCPIVLHRAFRPQEFIESMRANAVSGTLLAPTMLSDLIEAGGSRGTLPQLRKIIYSAAPMPEALLRRAIAAFGAIFSQVYGMTESGGPGCTLHAHQHVIDGPAEVVRRLRSAGQPMIGCDVRTVRPDGSECDIDEPGEIVIRSDALMTGYWNNPDATRETLRNGFLHTGDIGQVDAGGFVYVVDRLKEMIISGGENIYSREVENALMAHPAVIEAAVVGAPDPRWGESVAAFLVLRPGAAPPSAAAIDAHCRSLIAAYKCPKQVHVIDALPKLPNGKIEKFKLRERLRSG